MTENMAKHKGNADTKAVKLNFVFPNILPV